MQAFNKGTFSQVLWFWAALFYWALCAWYTARLILERSFKPFDYLLPCDSEGFPRFVVKWTPRILGLSAVVPIALLFLFDEGMKEFSCWLRWSPVAIAAAFFIFFVFRRKVLGHFVEPLSEAEALSEAEEGYGYPRFRKINRQGLFLIAILFAVSWLLLVLFLTIDTRYLARHLGAPAILLFALGSWCLFGGFALMYLPMSWEWPPLSAWPFVLAAVFSFWMDNHNVPVGSPPKADSSPPGWQRPTLEQKWMDWQAALQKTGCARGPIYLVAMSGGATRASFWAAHMLSAMEMEDRKCAAVEKREPCFARSIFAISGVSGGSLGAATFVLLLAEEQVREAHWPDLTEASAEFLGRDVLAPVIGYMLFQDGLQRFLPFAVPAFDRSHGLEDAWIADWAEMVAAKAPKGAAKSSDPRNWFNRPMRELYDQERNKTLPSLFLNTTRVRDGKKIVQSNIDFLPPDAHDLYAKGFLTERLTLAGAVHNSARFAYVSPAGQVWKWDDEEKKSAPWGYVVDGGYFENSGSATLAAMIREIAKKDPGNARRLVLITMSNDPSDGEADYVCMDKHRQKDVDKSLKPLTQSRAEREKKKSLGSFGMEVAAPAVALYQTRSSRAHAADIEAASALDIPDTLDTKARDALAVACESGRVAELRIPIPDKKALAPPMSWFLNKDTQKHLKDLFTTKPAAGDTPARRLCENLQTLRWRVRNPLESSPPAELFKRCWPND